MKQRFVAKVFVILMAFVMLFSLCAFTIDAASTNAASQTTTQTTQNPKRKTYTQALEEINDHFAKEQEAAERFWPDGVKELKKSKTYDALGATVITQIAQCIAEGEDFDWKSGAGEIFKGVINLVASCYGLGGISDALLDAMFRFGEQPQSNADILGDYYKKQLHQMNEIQDDIAELSKQVDAMTQVIEDEFAADDAKDKVMEFMSDSGSDFNYKRFKNYLYGSSTDAYGNSLYYTQAYYDQLVKSLVPEDLEGTAPDEVIKENYDALYRSMASTSQHDANINLLYNYLLYNKESGQSSIQRYYYDYLSSNKKFLDGRNAEYEALKFALDVYTTALFAEHCIAMCNNYQLLWIYENCENLDLAVYDYGDGKITYAQILLSADASAGRLAAMEQQMVADVAYILNMEGSVVIQDDNNSLRVMTDDDAGWGYVQLDQTIHLNKLADEWCDIFGFDTDAFSYEWYSNGELIETNDGIFKVDGQYSSFKGVVKYKGDVEELYSIEFVVADAPTFIGGSGDEEDPYVISCAEQFKLIASSKDNMGKHYILAHDIDFTSVSYEPIGTEEIPFTGILNGNGYAIKNLKVTADNYVGLFGKIGEGGVVQNLNIENCEFKIENENVDKVYTGAIAATNAGQIYNCYISNSSIVVDGENSQKRAYPTVFAGGVAGLCEGHGEISYCKVENMNISASLYHDHKASVLNSTEVFVGGIVASMIEKSTVHSCYVSNSVVLNANATAHVNFWGYLIPGNSPVVRAFAAGIVARFEDIAKITNVWSEANIQSCKADIDGYDPNSGNYKSNIADPDQYVATKYLYPPIADELKNAIKAPSKEAIAFPSQAPTYDISYSFTGEFNDKYGCYAGQLYDCNEKALKTDDLNILINGENVKYTVISYYNFDTFNSDKFATKMNTVLVTFSANYNDAEIVGKLELPITIAENSPTGLEIAVKPEKTVYDRGEPVSLDGGSFILRYQDGTTIDVTSEINPPVCDTSEDGTKQVIVSYGDHITTYDIVVACAHDYYDTLFVPTCYAYGYTLHTCRKCSVSYRSDETDKIAHMTTAQNAVAATCTEPGHTADFVCTMCQQIIVEGEEIPPVGHDFIDAARDAGAHYCTVCNAGEEHLFRTTENEAEIICTCVICGFDQPYVQNDRGTLSKLPRVVVSDAYSLPGSNEVIVYIELYSEIGISGAEFSVYFGNELELVSCSQGNILNDCQFDYYPRANQENFGYINVSWSGTGVQYVGNDGDKPNTLLKLVFRTPECATVDVEYPITIVNRADINSKGQTIFVSKFKDANVGDLEFIALNGKIKVVDRLPGDVVGDGTIDVLDAIIIHRYSLLSGFPHERELFVNDLKEQYEHFDITYGDVWWTKEEERGVPDTGDVIQILRYIVGGYEARLLTKDFYVTLNFNDGTGNESKIPVIYDEHGNIIFENLPVAKRTGYRFDGWYYGFGEKAVQMGDTYEWQKNAYEQTLYAHYTLNSITFVGNGAEGHMGSISYAKDITAPQVWTVDNQFTKTSTVTFMSLNEDVKDETVPVSHDFVGWGIPVPNSLPDKPEYVNYDGQRYEIKYRVDQGQSINLKDEEIGNLTLYAVWSTEYIDVPAMPRAGYHISQWTSDRDHLYFAADANSKYAVTTSTTLFAQWKLTPYTVTWGESEGYTVQVVRTHSKGKEIPDEKLDNGATVYYGDVLMVAYTNNAGFIITNSGEISITVMGDVDSSKIYATGTFVPGLYNENCEMVASWDDLVNIYRMKVETNYSAYASQPSASHPYNVFKNNEALADGSVLVIGNVNKIGNRAFQNCTNLTSVIIIDGVSSIGTYAFDDCTELHDVILGNNITVIGEYAFSGCSSLTSIVFGENSQLMSIGSSAFSCCSSLTNIEIPESVTSISYYAFYNCTGLTSITIPDSVTSIGEDAFSGCTSLTSITIPDGVTSISARAFSGCAGLTSITIPDSVTNIDDKAFYNCTGLTSITIPDSVTSIGDYAFDNCTGLTSITIPDGVTSIGNYVFCNCTGLTSITIPDSVTNISDYAFWDCTGLTSVIIPDGVTSIGKQAFRGCISLPYISIPNSVTSIGPAAFYNCTGLTSVVIPDSVTSIGSTAFYGCTSLTSVTIGNNVSNIDSYAFRECKSLTSIVIPDSVTYVGNGAFYECRALESVSIGNGVTSIEASVFMYCYNLRSVTFGTGVISIGNNAFYSCKSLTSVTIPHSVTTMGSQAFCGCEGLTSVTIPGSVTSVGWSAFSDCTGLTSITISDGVTEISGCAFYHCSGLTSITIPNSVTNIGASAFERCQRLTSITIPNSVTSIGESAFDGCSSLKSITIPNSVTSISQYMFFSCGQLENVIISNGVTSIDKSAFDYCSALTSVVIPNSVTSIGSSAFSGCTSLADVYYSGTADEWKAIVISSTGQDCLINATIHYDCDVSTDGMFMYAFDNASATYAIIDYIGYATEVVIPSTYQDMPVTSVGNYAFHNCASLTSITIPDSITSIGNYAFNECTSLTSITIPNSVTSIGNYAFAGCTNLPNIIIPNSVTTIGSYAFYYCESFTSITIPDSITSISDCAFASCINVASIELPNSITSIGNGAFASIWKNLRQVIIPEGVTSIGDRAFAGCHRLSYMVIPNSVTIIGQSVVASTNMENGWIDYAGTEEEWAAISIGSNNPELAETTIQYNCKG